MKEHDLLDDKLVRLTDDLLSGAEAHEDGLDRYAVVIDDLKGLIGSDQFASAAFRSRLAESLEREFQFTHAKRSARLVIWPRHRALLAASVAALICGGALVLSSLGEAAGALSASATGAPAWGVFAVGAGVFGVGLYVLWRGRR